MNGELPIIIECRCNDMDYRKDNPNFPYTPQEIIREAVRAWEAGASIFHWHGRDPNGELVEMVVKMARILGREVATPAQAREILKMLSRSEFSTPKVEVTCI